jgi:phage terminase large subunit
MQVETVDLTRRYDPRTNKRQMEFHAAPEMYKLFGGAMGGGKTGALINEGQQLNLDYPGNFGLLIRKTWPSFRDTVLPQVEKFTDTRLVADWNHSSKYIYYKNGSRTHYGGLGDKPDDWEKWMSGEYGWIAIDQAEQFTALEFEMLATRLRLRLPGILYFFLLSCNPNVGWIKERFIESNLEDHIFIPSLPTDNLANLPKDYIARMRKVLTPQLQKALLEGDWEAIGEPDNVFAYLEVQRAAERQVEPSQPVEIGVDVARSGDDESVIALREGLRVQIHSQARGHDTMKTAGEVWRCCQDKVVPYWGPKLKEIRIKVDADGLGAGVVDRLKEQRLEKEAQYTYQALETVGPKEREDLHQTGHRLRIKIIEIHGSGKAKEPAKYKNQRAEIHFGALELLSDLDLPKDREVQTQLMSLKYKVNSAGQIQIVPKDEIKKKLGRSPDVAEAIIYALADVRPKTEPRIWRA